MLKMKFNQTSSDVHVSGVRTSRGQGCFSGSRAEEPHDGSGATAKDPIYKGQKWSGEGFSYDKQG